MPVLTVLGLRRFPALISDCAELGWVDGRTVSIVYRWAGKLDRYSDFAAEFVQLKVAGLAPLRILSDVRGNKSVECDAFCVKEISEASVRGETRRVFDIPRVFNMPINQTHMTDVIRYQCCIALGCVGDVRTGEGHADRSRPTSRLSSF